MSIKYTYISITKNYISFPYYFKYSFSRKFDCSNVELGHKVNLHLSFSGCLTEISIRKSITIPTNMLSECFKYCDGKTIGIKVYIYNWVLKYHNLIANFYTVISYTLPLHDKDLHCLVSKTLK